VTEPYWKRHCQSGGENCRAGQRDGVICADGECDIDDGIRAADSAPTVIDAARTVEPCRGVEGLSVSDGRPECKTHLPVRQSTLTDDETQYRQDLTTLGRIEAERDGGDLDFFTAMAGLVRARVGSPK
jgi:hypothetical protein